MKQSADDSTEGKIQTDLLKKLLMLELFQLGVSQADIGKKLKIQTVTVNNFLKGIKRKESNRGEAH